MKSFTVRQTNILKGIAVLMLLVHHSLPPIPGEVLGAFEGVVQQSISLSKICVAIYAVLSGYGMYLSYVKREREGREKSIWRFSLVHIWKIYAVFWLAAGISIGSVVLLKGNFREIYGENPVRAFFLDGMALSYLTGTPKFVNSWWYVTATLLYYALFPFCFRIVQRLKEKNYILMAVLMEAVFLPQKVNSAAVYGTFFVFGMIFAERDVIERLLKSSQKGKAKKWLRVSGYCLGIGILCVLRQTVLAEIRTEYYFDWLPALLLILLVSELGSCFNPVKTGVLERIGSYSFEMYLLHGVFLKYFGKFIYQSLSCWAVLARLFAVTYAAAVFLKWLEGILGILKITKRFPAGKGA